MSILRKQAFSCILILTLGLFFSCDSPNNPFGGGGGGGGNPFTNNLGEKVDVAPPTIKVLSPSEGSYIKGEVEFRGTATAYRELTQVEVKIHNNNNKNEPLVDWTKKGVTLIGGDIKSRSFIYRLDTLDTRFGPEGLDDDILTIQFRARDPSQYADTVELIYIVKNKPSQISMTVPNDSELKEYFNTNDIQTIPKVPIGYDINGQIVDRRGIKPGYPRIKIWKDGDSEPGADKWGTLFLSDVDFTPANSPENWTYVDRANMPVVQIADFRFNLSDYTVNANNEIKYDIPIKRYGAGTYHFRIMTYETYFNSDAVKYMHPRPPQGDEVELLCYYPWADPGNDAYLTSGPYYTFDVKPDGVPPDIVLDNSDVNPQTLLEETPNMYITKWTSLKQITGGTVDREIFRLRVKATHKTDEISSIKLRWGNGNTPGPNWETVTHPNDLTWEYISADTVITPGGPHERTAIYTAREGPSSSPNPFTSPGEYKLFIRATTGGQTYKDAECNVTVTNDKPAVSIRSIKGAYSEPPVLPAARDDHFTVNGNIQVTADYPADMGIKQENGKRLVKWIVVGTGDSSIENALNAYESDPTPAGLNFFNNINNNGPPSVQPQFATGGWVEGGTLSGDFKYNTNNHTGSVYLYVIAQDMNQRLGWERVILDIDQSTDFPEMETPGMTSKTAAADPITDENGLFIRIKDDQTQDDPSQTKRNVLDKDTGINLTFKDDDGIRLEDITITIKDLNSGTTKTLTTNQVESILSPGNIKYREWTGTLSQKVMAEALIGSGSSYLKDGLYQLEISYHDDKDSKVSIVTGDVQEAPPSGTPPTEFFFCVRSEPPRMDITSPSESGFVGKDLVDVTGKITSRVPMQKAWISFEPNVISPQTKKVLTLYQDAACSIPSAWPNTTGTLDTTTGEYVYYWILPDVDFSLGGAGEDRSFSVEAVDNLGNFTPVSWAGKVDSKPPEVKLFGFFFDRLLEAGQATHRVNGKFNFVIEAADNDGIKMTGSNVHVKWWILPSAAAPPTWTTLPGSQYTGGEYITLSNDLGGGQYQVIVNSGSLEPLVYNIPNIGNLTYTLYAMAEDRAGNLSAVTALETFIIDQSADEPKVDKDSLSPPDGGVVKSDNLKITGTITDDDGFLAAKKDSYIKLQFNYNGTGWIDVTGDAIKFDPVNNALELSFDPMSNDTVKGYFSADGEKQYRIRVTDEDALNTEGGKNPPILPTGSSHPPGANTAITALIRYFPSETGWYTFMKKDQPPQITFLADDGSTFDKDGKNIFDTVFPTLSAALASGYVDDGYLEYVEISYDGKPSYVLFDYSAGTIMGSYPPPNPVRFTWSLTSATSTALLGSFAGDDEGLHTIIVTATDRAGTEGRGEWRFYKDTKGPSVSFNNIIDKRGNPVPPAGQPQLSEMTTLEGSEITGRFDDDYSNIGSAIFTFYKPDGGITAIPGGSGIVVLEDPDDPAKTKNWKITIPNAVGEGKRYFTITVNDALGNSTVIGDPSAFAANPPVWIAIDRNEPLVPEAMRVGDSTTLGPEFLPPKEIPNEPDRVFGAANLGATPGTNNDMMFTLSGTAYDYNLRNITFAIRAVSSANTPVVKGSLSLTAEWSAGAGPYLSTDSDTEQRMSATAVAPDYTWQWTIRVLAKDLNALKQTPGFTGSTPCFISIEADDFAGRKSEIRHWRFFLDTKSPEIDINNIDANNKTVLENTGDVSLMGSARDDNRIRKIEYYISKYNYATDTWQLWNNSQVPVDEVPPASPPGPAVNAVWADKNSYQTSFESWIISGSTLPSTQYGTANIFNQDGRYRITIRAFDWSLGITANAANTSFVQREFYIDRADPVIEWINPNKDKPYFRSKSDGTIELAFTATDQNFIDDAITVTMKQAGTDTIVKTFTAGEIAVSAAEGNSVTGYIKTVNLTPNVSGLAGRYTMTLTVKDGAGKTTTLTRDITLDNTPPAIIIDDVTGTNSDLPADIVKNNIAMTGRKEFRGRFEKATGTSPVSFIAFYIAPGGATAPGNLSWLRAKDNDLNVTTGSADLSALSAAGWRFDPSAAELKDNNGSGPVLARIGEGLVNANVLIRNTSSLTYSTPVKYSGDDAIVTTGVTFGGAAIPSGDTINQLKIYFLAMDEAGNRNISIYDYWIYPEGDRPSVILTSPNENEPLDKRLLNGRIRIGGTAKDNFRVKNVWFRILVENPAGSGTFTVLTEDDRVSIPVWNDAWEPDPNGASQKSVSLSRGSNNYGDGWFMASGGGKAEVPWYAYINSNGELEPLLAGRRLIRIEVLAEDIQYNEYGNLDPPGEGLLSKYPPKGINAYVVKGAPEFSNEEIRRNRSALPAPDPVYPWLKIQEANIRKRAAYRVTVSHESGLKEISWTPNGQNPINLFDAGSSYNSQTYTQEINYMDNAVTTGTGIAVKAGPKNVITGPGKTLNANTRYLIWKYDKASLPPSLSAGSNMIPGYGDFDDLQYVIYIPPATITDNLGANVFMEENAEHKFEWEIVVDVHADLINNGSYKYPTPPPDSNKDNYSGRYVVNLRATENSKTVPLSTDYRAELPIDNQPPEAAYTHNGIVAGQNASFGGLAGDYAPASGVSGLDRVVLWFSRKQGGVDTPFLWDKTQGGSFKGGGTVPEGVTGLSSAMMPKWQDYDDPESTDYKTKTNYSCIVIKYNDPMGKNTVFGHNLPIGFATVGGDLSTAWYVELDSTKMESGRITAHFIVYDKAGNARYYKQSLVVMNNVPMIRTITLATDIRGDLGFTGDFTGNRSWGTGSNYAPGADHWNSPYSAFPAPTDNIRGKTYYNSTNSTITKGVSEPIPIKKDYGAVHDEAFNVRNRLLAVRVDVDQNLDEKGRTFRLEYVSRATLLDDNNQGRDFYKKIVAGRVYIINEPGSTVNPFPWNAFGAQGVPRKGLAFMAIKDGIDETLPASDYSFGALKPSVWELNTSYYAANSPIPVPANVPAALRLGDVRYNPVSGSLDAAKRAEFVYSSNAFDATPFSHGQAATNILDFTPTISYTNDNYNRPAPYPAIETLYPWEAHSLFIIKVFGGGEEECFGDFALLSIRVNNEDRTKPYAQLYDINPKAEGTEAAQTRAQALGMNSIGGNRTKGGLYNTGTMAEVAKSGHIEPRRATTLTSAQMGGAASATSSDVKITKPFADPSKFFTAANDTLSGEVILRGYVEDDQRIGGVRLNLGGGANDFVDILQPKTTGTNNSLLVSGAGDRVAWYDTVDLNRHRVEWAYLWNTEDYPANTIVGNNITVSAIAYNADASNERKTSNPSDTFTYAQATAAQTRDRYNIYNPGFAVSMPRYNQIAFNLRPYITGFLRNKAQFSNNTRSRQGRYMFYRGETAVLKGFNLGGGNTSAPVINLPGMGNFTTVAVGAIGDFDIPAPNPSRYRQFTVNATSAATGNGMVFYSVTNGQAYYAVNTYNGQANTETERMISAAAGNLPIRPTNIMPWNIEYFPGKNGSDLWDDFIQVHIWQSNDGNNTTTGTDLGVFRKGSTDREVFDPSMSIDPATGTLWSSHNEGGGGSSSNSGSTKVGNNSGAASLTVASFIDPIINSDIYISTRPSGYNNNGNNNAFTVWAAYSIIGKPGGGTAWNNFGGIWLSGPQGRDPTHTSGVAVAGNNGFRNNADAAATSQYYGESTYYNSQPVPADGPNLNQFKNPHIITYLENNNLEHIHVSYYDSKDGSIKYRYNRRPATGSSEAGTVDGTGAPRVWTNLDGGVDAEDESALAASGAFPTVTAGGRIKNYASSVTATISARGNINAGEYNSIAITNQGFPVIAYYDKTNQKLKMAISNSTRPVEASAWTIISNVIPAGNPNAYGTGEYVSMKIDTRVTPNVVHIAAMNSQEKNLVYVKGTISGTTFTVSKDARGNDIVQVVDSVGSVGRWCTLSLDNSSPANPWISYQDESYQGSRDGVKLAYYSANTFYKGGAYRNGEDTDLYGIDITGWEAMHVPTAFRVENARLGMECYPVRNYTGAYANKNWSGAVGYLGQDYFRAAYYWK